MITDRLVTVFCRPLEKIYRFVGNKKVPIEKPEYLFIYHLLKRVLQFAVKSFETVAETRKCCHFYKLRLQTSEVVGD